MVGQNVLYEIPSRSGGQEGLNLNILNEMFDQAAASATEEEYPADYQKLFSYLIKVFEWRQIDTLQETLLLFIELKCKVIFARLIFSFYNRCTFEIKKEMLN